jgi:nucleoside-diphosphate-sugar epimerase
VIVAKQPAQEHGGPDDIAPARRPQRVLVVGGSGHVGTFITPYLQRAGHSLRILDVRPPTAAGVEYIGGSVTDPEAVARALDGVDSFLWVVMQKPQGGSVTDQDVATILANYEVNGKGLHLMLFLAQQRGIRAGIYTSTMSVHFRHRPYYPGEDETPLDTPSVYGLTKGYGESTCRYFARWFGMHLMALRITGPRTRTQFLDERRNRPDRVYPDGTATGSRIYILDEADLARAYLGAIDAITQGAAGAPVDPPVPQTRRRGRFDAIFIAGDEDEEWHNLGRARNLLGWSPRSHQLLAE